MSKIIKDPIDVLNTHVPAVVSRFNFDREPRIIRQTATPSNDSSIDKDPCIYDGLIVTTHGFGRIARHRPTGALCLLTAKRPNDLRGKRDEDGTVRGVREELEKAYIISVYRSTGEYKDIYRNTVQLRRSMQMFGEKLGERSEKHFTLICANLTTPDPKSKKYNTNTPTEVYTNGRLAYLLDYTDKGKYEVRFYAPTRRKGGSFVPVSLGKTKMADKFASVSRLIAKTNDYIEARNALAEHWQNISSKLWDEENIYKGEGLTFNLKKFFSIFGNVVADHTVAALSTATVGVGVSIINPAYGIIGGLLYAASHTTIHALLDESYHASYTAYKRTKEAKNRYDIDSYPLDVDVSDHFKVQTTANIKRLYPKMDLERFDPDDFEFLDSKQSHILRDHELAEDGFQHDSLRGHLISAHQRGYSSSCMLPDLNTRLDVFQSGLVRMMHEQEDGKTLIFARYRPDACLVEGLRLPETSIKQFGEGILRLEYERDRDDFRNAFNHASNFVTVEEMIEEISPRLFRGNRHKLSNNVIKQSMSSIREAFAEPDRTETPSYMAGNPPTRPDIRAFVP